MASVQFKSSMTAFWTSKSLFKNIMFFFAFCFFKGFIFFCSVISPLTSVFTNGNACMFANLSSFPANSGKYSIPSSLHAGVSFNWGHNPLLPRSL